MVAGGFAIEFISTRRHRPPLIPYTQSRNQACKLKDDHVTKDDPFADRCLQAESVLAKPRWGEISLAPPQVSHDLPSALARTLALLEAAVPLR